MASWSAIQAVSAAIQSILEIGRNDTPFASATIELFQTSSFAAPPVEGVSIYLYRVGLHGAQRNLPPRRSPDGTCYRPSLPLDLHYLLTPWARTVTRQQELLGWLIRTLEDQQLLPAALLNRGTAVFGANEGVDLIAQPLASAELVAVWEFNKAVMQPSMTYVARMVLLDSNIVHPEGPRLQSRGLAGEPRP